MFNQNEIDMKKIILAVCLAFGGATLVNAQEQQTDRTQSPTQQSQTIDQDQDREEISISDLPDGVTAQLESSDYSGWTVGNAYKKTGEDQNEIFIVEMRQGTETKKIKFDKDGNKLDKDKYKHSDKADKTESTQYRDESAEDATSEDVTSEDESSDLDAPSSEDATESTTEDATIEEDATTEEDAVDQADNTQTQDQK